MDEEYTARGDELIRLFAMLMTLTAQEMCFCVKRGSKLFEHQVQRENQINSIYHPKIASSFQEGDSLVLGINYLEGLLRCACLQVSVSSVYF